MSFWAGIAKGFQDAEAKAEREDAVEREQERYDAETARAERWRSEDMARQDAIRAQDLAMRAEEIAIARGTQLIGMGAGGAGVSSSGGSGNVPTPEQGVEAVQALRFEVEEMGGLEGMSDTDKEFFGTLMENPSAAAGVMGFVLEQREDGNAFEISRLPDVINIVGIVEGQGEEAYREFQKNFAEGNVNLNDPEAFLDGIRALRNYRPAEVLWAQSGPVRDLTDQEKMYNAWQTATMVSANAALASMDKESPEYRELFEAINAAESSDSRVAARGFSVLWGAHGRPAAEMVGVDGSNVYMKPYFAGDNVEAAPTETPAIPAVPSDTPTIPSDPTTTGELGTPLTAPPRTETTTSFEGVDPDFVFNNKEEAVAVFNSLPHQVKAQVPYIVVGGQKFANREYGVIPDRQTMTLEAQGVDPSDFEVFMKEVVEGEPAYEGYTEDQLVSLYRRYKDIQSEIESR